MFAARIVKVSIVHRRGVKNLARMIETGHMQINSMHIDDVVLIHILRCTKLVVAYTYTLCSFQQSSRKSSPANIHSRGREIRGMKISPQKVLKIMFLKVTFTSWHAEREGRERKSGITHKNLFAFHKHHYYFNFDAAKSPTARSDGFCGVSNIIDTEFFFF